MEYQTYPIEFKPIANSKATILYKNVRFSILSNRIIRCEYDPKNVFEDHPSQAFWYREQPNPEFSFEEKDDQLIIETDYLLLTYHPTSHGFSQQTLSIQLKQFDSIWHFGDKDRQNLKGTGRTLDEADGEIRLEPGLLSRSGWAVIDDSDSLIFDERGWIMPRPSQTGQGPKTIDLYFFGYGHEYLDCLNDYSKIAGKVPLLPRWVLGNWWSRYWNYTDEELKQLMMDFKSHQIPLSVCIVDMDWHITDTGNFSSGWTGYTWNKDYFPEPKEFISWLHQEGLKTALNLHPAEGIHPHEKDYPEMAEAMGVDPKSKMPIKFDIADPAFTHNYFDILHHRKEENEGIDFWWMDWQQGVRVKDSKNPNSKFIDPLWWLNHLHFYDLQRKGSTRGFIFSRWGGLGNHRYPIGFSGDTEITWATLAFLPYFTATASNVGYSWWSHDIGGHNGGIEEDELFVRWVQYGVFSPIFRLHSTKNPYHDRTPWGHGKDNLEINRKFMQLRHQLIPYIYTMSWRNYDKNIPFIWPMYYQYPDSEAAYFAKDQYLFGSELLIAPFVRPTNQELNLSDVTIWFPEGIWFNLFTGQKFEGDRYSTFYGDLEDYPAFAPSGAILPLDHHQGWGSGLQPTKSLDINVFAGADNEFALYEDDGNNLDYVSGKFSLTTITQKVKTNNLIVTIQPGNSNRNYVPENRYITILVFGIQYPEEICVKLDNEKISFESEYEQFRECCKISGISISPNQGLELTIKGNDLYSTRDRRPENIRKMLKHSKINSWLKQGIDNHIDLLIENPDQLEAIGNQLTPAQIKALRDILAY